MDVSEIYRRMRNLVEKGSRPIAFFAATKKSSRTTVGGKEQEGDSRIPHNSLVSVVATYIRLRGRSMRSTARYYCIIGRWNRLRTRTSKIHVLYERNFQEIQTDNDKYFGRFFVREIVRVFSGRTYVRFSSQVEIIAALLGSVALF